MPEINLRDMNTAILHYWLVNMRGGERVIQSIARIFPKAPLYTHVVSRDALSEDLRSRDIQTTFIQRLPQASKRYQRYLPLMPLALEELDLRKFDLVISSESGPSKGVVISPSTTHVCYCHSPMRYVWDMYHDYMSDSSFIVRLLMRPICHYLRLWDYSSAARVDQFVANSRYVAERIFKFYRRESIVIPPPVAVSDFTPTPDKEDFYLFFGELVNYKRADLAIEAFRTNGKRLVIAGKGERLEELRRSAPSNVTFTGALPFPEVKRYLAKARALIFPGVEDFGIIPVEALASGTPVIAFGKGGALDTITDRQTGILFNDQTPNSLNLAILAFESGEHSISIDAMISQSQRFSTANFERRFAAIIRDTIEARRNRIASY